MSLLVDYRKKLLEINHQLLDLMIEREEMATKIRKLKFKEDLPAYDPERELFLFTTLAPKIKRLGLEGLEIFSLMMQQQADESYPQWSQGVHLTSHSHKVRGEGLMMNPLLLLLFYPKLIKVEDLNPDFQFLAKFVSGNKSSL